MSVLIGLIAVIFGILQIVLFFKLWGMTNDIREIKEKYLLSNDSQAVKKEINSSKGLGIDDLVIEIKTGKQMRIKSIAADGKFSCYTGGGSIHAGDFDASEIRPFYQ